MSDKHKHACTFLGMQHDWGPWRKQRKTKHYPDATGERRYCKNCNCRQDRQPRTPGAQSE